MVVPATIENRLRLECGDGHETVQAPWLTALSPDTLSDVKTHLNLTPCPCRMLTDRQGHKLAPPQKPMPQHHSSSGVSGAAAASGASASAASFLASALALEASVGTA